MKIRNLLFAVLALLASLPVVADNEFTDEFGNVWTYEYVDPEDPSQGVTITSSSVEGNVLPIEISVGDVTLPVIGIGLTLEDGITSIPDGFFEDNTRLTSIIIPNTVTSIGERAFHGCTNLTSVIIPNSVTSIGTLAFYGCRSLISIDLPESLTFIPAQCFDGCWSLSSVTIPNSVTSIGEQAFGSCGLTSITIPNSVIRIDCQAFVWSGLTSVNIPNSVTYIGEEAFSRCHNLTSIHISASVIDIANNAFQGAVALASITVDEENMVYDSRENCNAIIETASNTLVTGCQNTTIPSTVTKLGSNSFSANNLTSLYIPEGVTDIDDDFLSCTSGGVPISLTTIVVAPENPVYDSREDCNAIIETSTNTLIRGCMNSTIPSSVTSIGNNAFRGFDITSIIIPSSVASIGSHAFFDCPGLSSIVIPSSVTSIGERAFGWCSLTSITVPEGLVSISDGAFLGNPLTSITISSTVTSIGENIFESALSSVESIVVAEGNTKYDSRNNCNAIIETETKTLIVGCQNATVPSSVTRIAGGAFSGGGFTAITNDPSLASETCLYIPSSVTSMGGGFSDALTTVILPEGLTELLEYSFGGGVTSLTSTKTTPFVLENPNIGVALNCVLHIPAGTRDAYIAAGWTEEVFGGGIVEDGEGIPESVTVTLSSVGAGTFCSKYDLDFSGTEDVKAYIVSAFMPSTGEVTLTRIKYVPALTGVVLLGNEGTYDIPLTDNQIVVANMLAGVTERTQLYRTEGRYTNFILSKDEGVLGFYLVANGSILSAGKAYLPLLTNLLPSYAPSLSIRFDDGDATSIEEMEADVETEAWHDLSGRTLSEQPTAKGIYIVNGKKVVVK